MKKCFKCESVLPRTHFYKHKQMADGLLGKCKSCTKKDALLYRNDNILRIREYDRSRGNRKTEKYRKEYINRFKNKYFAHNCVSNAKRDKKLFGEPCEICGAKKPIHAHHDDYLKPLNIRWLCSACHSQWHAKNGEAKNP